jgi:hypothetical protein
MTGAPLGRPAETLAQLHHLNAVLASAKYGCDLGQPDVTLTYLTSS